MKARGRVTLVQEIAQEQGVQAQPTVQAWKMGRCIEVRWPRLWCVFCFQQNIAAPSGWQLLDAYLPAGVCEHSPKMRAAPSTLTIFISINTVGWSKWGL